MVKLLNAKKYQFRRHHPLSKSHTRSHCIVGGSVPCMSAIRRQTFKVALPRGLDQSHQSVEEWRSPPVAGPDQSHQSVEEWCSPPVAGPGRAGQRGLEDGCSRVGLNFGD